MGTGVRGHAGQKDATGHTVYGDIGVFLRDKLNAYTSSPTRRLLSKV